MFTTATSFEPKPKLEPTAFLPMGGLECTHTQKATSLQPLSNLNRNWSQKYESIMHITELRPLNNIDTEQQTSLKHQYIT